MATVGSAIVCDRLRLYGNRSLCDRLRSTIRDRLRSAIVCDRLRSYGNQPLDSRTYVPYVNFLKQIFGLCGGKRDTLDLKKSDEVVFCEGEKTKFGPFYSQNRSGKLFGIFRLNEVK